ncbi:MAG TPA: hypothetical protein ENL33_01265, partial [Candidatus Parcubacteria bacterium]|nr:hypothetical protein [Candidatus Parcubacteria bacterium]
SLLDQAFTFSGVLKTGKEIKTQDIKNILGLVEVSIVADYVDFLSQKQVPQAIDFLNQITDKGFDLQEFSRALINYLRQMLILKVVGLRKQPSNPMVAGLTKEELKKLEKQIKAFSQEDLSKIIKIFLEAENKMKYSPVLQLPLELATIESCLDS